MKISVNWLKDYLTFDEPAADLAQDLSMLGLTVDTIERQESNFILDIDVTANRPDCLSHIGIARELAAFYGEPLRLPGGLRTGIPEVAVVPAEIQIDDPDLCHRYVGLVISGVQVKESPPWIQNRLKAVGQRPINNVVDITNFVLLELGHPLHAFDYQTLKEGRIVVRRARGGEKIRTLDDVERVLDPEMLVIADASDPVALAGVMGGALTEVTEKSEVILLESAWFLPTSVRKTARKLGLNTEASYRFERGADPVMAAHALLRTAALIQEYAGGEVASPVIDVFPVQGEKPAILLRLAQIRRLVGVDPSKEFVENALRRLEFRIEERTNDGWRIVPPSFRPDIGLEVDLIEEVARFYGYNHLPQTLPEFTAEPLTQPDIGRRYLVREFWREAGFQEILTTSFTSCDETSPFNRFHPGDAVMVDNPLVEEEPYMRGNLLQGMLTTLKFNENNANQNVRLFEMGAVYGKSAEGIRESEHLSWGVFGSYMPENWLHQGTGFQFFHLKGVLDSFFTRFGIDEVQFLPADDCPFLQPGKAALVKYRGSDLALLGQLNQRVMREWKFRQDVFLGEFILDELLALQPAEFRFKAISKFPLVSRDISFTVDKKVSFGTIIKGLFSLKIPELRDIELFDIYKGKDVPLDQQAMTIRLIFQSAGQTLTDSTADELRDAAVGFLVKRFKIRFR